MCIMIYIQFGELKREYFLLRKRLNEITGEKKTLQAQIGTLKSQIKISESAVEDGQATIREIKVLFY